MHNGDHVQGATQHNGDHVQGGTQHNGDHVQGGTMYRGKAIGRLFLFGYHDDEDFNEQVSTLVYSVP